MRGNRKIFLGLIAALAVLVIVGAAAAYVVVFEPYIEQRSERISAETEILEVIYFPIFCLFGSKDETLWSRYRVVGQPTEASQASKLTTLVLAFPSSLVPPETPALVGGNFRVTGYLYRHTEANILTGSVREAGPRVPRRFDVVSWESISFYDMVEDRTMARRFELFLPRTEPLRRHMGSRDHAPDQFSFPKGLETGPDDCMDEFYEQLGKQS